MQSKCEFSSFCSRLTDLFIFASQCHGLSGSCTMKTCWMKLPSFAEVAHRLRDRFDGASKVIAKNDGIGFMTEGLSIKPPTKQDLVYTDESPDFCKANLKTGSFGKNYCKLLKRFESSDGKLCCRSARSRMQHHVERRRWMRNFML